MLRYTLRIRDLVHGTTLFTEDERKIIDHPFFQRLRQVRQNDVAFYVYPSLDTSRFEHVLGTCRVAGMMAESLTHSPKWKTYARELKAQTGIASREGFVELARLYALLHDIGHLPLSHLFEMAVKAWAPDHAKTVEEWSGVSGFAKLHEALGAMIAEQMLRDVVYPVPIRGALLRLMTEKAVPPSDPLSVVKSLVDSEIDADRIDFVQRDGLLAGGEYGHYDIRRLCDAVFLERDDRGWLIAFSEKALTSMEALLLDRYRTHVWVHFHHRVVATKMLVRFLVARALERELITRGDFSAANAEAFALKDDVWLWNLLRQMPADDELIKMVKRAVFLREKKHVLTLWKSRPEYHEVKDQVERKARVTDIDFGILPGLPGFYETQLADHLGVRILRFDVEFKPITTEAVLIYSGRGKTLTSKHLLEVSRLLTDLEAIWEDEPHQFMLLVGENAAERVAALRKEWVEFTARWVRG